MQAPPPSLPIERGRPGPGLLAHVALAKYADDLPLHRQTEIHEREEITLADWVGTHSARYHSINN
jgi:transposase